MERLAAELKCVDWTVRQRVRRGCEVGRMPVQGRGPRHGPRALAAAAAARAGAPDHALSCA